VNRDLILLYWDVGQAIDEKQNIHNWGDSVVEMVAADLRRAFPEMRGFSPDSIWRMRQFYSEYADASFLEQAVPEIERRVGKRLERGVPEGPLDEFLSLFVREMLAPIPWGHHVELLKKIKDPLARVWYLQATARLGWSRNVLLNQIKAGAYERALTEKKTHNFDVALPEHLAEQADEMLKSSYNLEFLGIRRVRDEINAFVEALPEGLSN
jgi:predicted nuclease of restriction endonuclease-like (RecB) superfamily